MHPLHSRCYFLFTIEILMCLCIYIFLLFFLVGLCCLKIAKFLCQENSKPSMSLLAIAVGIKQKEIVDRIVKKVMIYWLMPFTLEYSVHLWCFEISVVLQFLSSDFVVMLFHYDGAVDKWRDLNWSDRAIHVSVMNQTKW